jgi:SAM-dependent methyltransferase
MKLCSRCQTEYESRDWRCPGCAAQVYLQEGIPAHAPELARSNNGWSASHFASSARMEEGHWWFVARNRLLTWAAAQYFGDMRSFLEVGCGTGFVLRGFARRFPNVSVSGSEIFQEGLLFARERVPRAAFHQMDARQIPFSDEFDVIGAFDVLEHIEEDEQVLQQLFRACTAGGGILITVPQHPWLWSKWDDFHYHKRRYTRAELVGKVRAAGFEILHVTSFVSLLLPLMVMSRLGSKLSSAPPSAENELTVGRVTHTVCSLAMQAEFRLLQAGVSLPAGGSLLLVARKTDQDVNCRPRMGPACENSAGPSSLLP